MSWMGVLSLLYVSICVFGISPLFAVSHSTSISTSISTSSSLTSRVVNGYETHSPFAYVAMHYEGTPNDDAYILALRVLITSIKLTKTPHDVVVLIADNVAESTRSLLRSDGAIVRPVANIPNPFKTAMTRRNSYKPRFEFTFNKLYLWNMTEYQRVVYLDSDNIVVDQQMDHLFMCGHFCAVYQNPSFFHTGLLVVKPSVEKFKALLTALNSADAFSYDGADQGFLIEQFMELEAAPLFQYKHVKDGKPFEDSAMRVPIIYSMNAMFFYLNFDWSYYRRSVYPFANQTLPFVSLGYPAAATLKPWFWWVHAFLINSHQWNLMRAHLTEDSYWPYAFTRIAMLIITLTVARGVMAYGEQFTMGIRKGYYKDTNPMLLLPIKMFMFATDQLRRATCWLSSLAPIRVGYGVGLFAYACAFYFAARQIPKLAPPTVAYPLFVTYHCVIVCVLLYIYITLLIPTQTKQTNVDHKELQQAVRDVSPYPNYIIPLYMLAGDIGIFVMLFGPFHIHFIGSLYYVIASFALNITLHAHFFRLAAERMTSLPLRDDLP